MTEKMRNEGRTVYRNGSWCRPQPEWMKAIVVGSVITNGGKWRIVRDVTRYHNGDLRCVDLVIQHCSWTHRCYTVVHANDLIQRGFRLVPVKPRTLRNSMDLKIKRAIHEPAWQKKSLTCCDVEGMA